MKEKPQIAVVLPVYNGIKFLKEAVQSVLNQDFENFEFVICDDCSSDGSYEYLKTIKHNNLLLLRNDRNMGLFPTLNILVKKVKSPLIHLWSQDDIMLPNCLSETIKYHEEFPDVCFSFSRFQAISNTGKRLKPPETFKHKSLSPKAHAISSILYGSISGSISNVCVLAKDLQKIGYFNTSMKYSGDFDILCKLSKHKPIGMNGMILVHIRQHNNQLSKKLEASYYKLQENLNIYECFLQTLNSDIRPYAQKALKWKIHPLYFTQFLFILKQNRPLSYKYLRFLRNYDSIYLLAIRWAVVNFLKLIKKEQVFYRRYLYKPLGIVN